jgi:hypothetical protein
MNIKPEDMLKESTMKELRPIATASETDTDPVDLFPQASQTAEVDSTDDYIIITDSETENMEDLEAYNVETDVDSPLFTAMPLPQPVQLPAQVPAQVPDKICGLCDTCTQAIRNLIRGCARVDMATQTDFETANGLKSPDSWVYTTPQDQRINNPYTPPARKPSPRRRLFLTYKPIRQI